MVSCWPRWLVIFSLTVAFAHGRTSETLKVQLSHGGTVVGRYLTTVKGRGMRAFMGVPYAKPPVGELRFMPPVPYPKWEGEKITTKDSEICIQRDPFRRDQVIEGSEDCLYINVYTPLLDEIGTKKLPVMVWFHGGGWECGSGISDFYGPDHLLDKDIVYVSGNFRLGPLGFLSTETLDCPGNNGMKDQVEILKWVKENIARFGGDPNSVTIFGESAGGASVTYHMMSKLSKGLFHKGIAQSGTYHNPWAQPAHKGVAASRAYKLAKLLHCENSENDWQQMLDCMRKLPADAVTAKLYDFYEWDYEPMIPFPLAVEPNHPGAFLTEYPRDIDHSKLHSLSIPLMAGATSGEGAMRSAAYLNNPELLKAMKEKYKHILPIMLNYDHHNIDKQKEVTTAIDKFYFKNGHNYHMGDHDNFTDLLSDGWFIAGFDEYLRQRLSGASKKIAGPTYTYLFDQKASASFTEIFHGGRENYIAVAHAEELQYLFPIGKHLFVSSIPTKDELKVRDGLVELWVNFATYANPTPSSSHLTKWNPSISYPLDYVRIGTKDPKNWVLLKNEKNYLQDRCDFWYNLKAHFPRSHIKDEL